MKAIICLSLLTGAAMLAQPQRPVEEFRTNAGVVKITPVRHASMMIEAGGKVIHVDPWGQGNYQGLPKADLIMLTDIHGHHMEAKRMTGRKKHDTVNIRRAEVAKTVTDAKVISNGDSTTWDKWRIEAVPMYNLKRGPSEGKLYRDKGRGNG